MSGIAPVMLHRSWETLSRLPKGCVACPRCKAVFPDNEARYWRWSEADEQWLCRRRSCMADDRPLPVDESMAWEDDVIDEADRVDRVLRELGL